MQRKFFASLLFLLAANFSFAAEPVKLEKIVVTPSRLRNSYAENSRTTFVIDEGLADLSSYEAIPDLIGNVGGIDIRRRGPNGVQADINIRGATFEQNAVLIDGVKVTDPQTGHYDMDLPVMINDVDRIEILKGPASSLYGPNAFGGVINIITKKPAGNKISFDASGGSFDYFQTALSASLTSGPVANRFSIEESRSTGYMPETEFNIFSLSDSARLETLAGIYNFLFGYTKKDYGADSFYSNLFSNEEEHTDTRFFKLDGNIDTSNIGISPKLFLRRHWDKFALDRNRPGWQTNYHTNYTYGGEMGFNFDNSVFNTAYGFELSRDTIDSTNLQTHSRTNCGAYIELSPRLGDVFNMNIGFREDYFSVFGWQYSPSVSIGYMPVRDLTLKASVGRAYRIPTFTDLYYSDSANRGNSQLAPESAWTYETGAEYRTNRIALSAAFFHRDSYNTIDWTRPDTKSVWQASNIGSVRTNGFEASIDASPKIILKDASIDKIFLNYTALDSYRKHDYLSKYALDYLKHQISAGVDYSLLGFKNSWVCNFEKRVGKAAFLVVDTKISKNIIRKGALSFEVFLEMTNLFDTDYSEQSDIPMPGRWIKSGGRLEF